MVRPVGARGAPTVRMLAGTIMPGTNDSALTKKAIGTPQCAIARPASAGPTMRAALNIAEFRAIAFIVEMVGRDDLMNAIALNSAMFNAARIVGPALATP